MGRPRGFDEEQVVTVASDLFVRRGYEATSIDDLVGATGLHRGSLYKAFGSKRGLFLAALHRLVDEELPRTTLDPEALVNETTVDLLLVAGLELAPHDGQVRELVERGCTLIGERAPDGGAHAAADLLGRRLVQRALTSQP